MRITTRQLQSQTSQILKRAAEGEQFTVLVNGSTPVQIVPGVRFDVKRRRATIRRVRAFRTRLARKGPGVTQEDIRAAIEESRK